MPRTVWIIKCANGEYVTPKATEVKTDPDIKQAREFTGKRARRWMKRHAWLGPTAMRPDGTPMPEKVDLEEEA